MDFSRQSHRAIKIALQTLSISLGEQDSGRPKANRKPFSTRRFQGSLPQAPHPIGARALPALLPDLVGDRNEATLSQRRKNLFKIKAAIATSKSFKSMTRVSRYCANGASLPRHVYTSSNPYCFTEVLWATKAFGGLNRLPSMSLSNMSTSRILAEQTTK